MHSAGDKLNVAKIILMGESNTIVSDHAGWVNDQSIVLYCVHTTVSVHVTYCKQNLLFISFLSGTHV